MFYTGRSKHLPNLSAFIRHRQTLQQENAATGWGVAVGSLLIVIAAMGLTQAFGMLRGMMSTVFIAAPIIAFSVWGLFRHFTRPKTDQDRKREEIREVLTVLVDLLDKRRLHRDLDKGSQVLLEEAARHWIRVKEALDGPFWTEERLAPHWRKVREQSLSAAEMAMDDLLLVLRPALRVRKPEDRSLSETIEEVVNTVFDRPGGAPDSNYMHPSFLPAREIAERLKLLAAAVEDASRERHAAALQEGEYDSTQTIDTILSDLRQIRAAESELQQDMRN